MKKLTLLLLFCAVPGWAGEKAWTHGKLVSEEIVDSQSAFSNQFGGGTIHHQTSEIVIDAGDRVYFAEVEAHARSNRLPQVTENSDVLFAIDHGSLWLKDDREREVKLRLTKTRMK